LAIHATNSGVSTKTKLTASPPVRAHLHSLQTGPIGLIFLNGLNFRDDSASFGQKNLTILSVQFIKKR